MTMMRSQFHCEADFSLTNSSFTSALSVNLYLNKLYLLLLQKKLIEKGNGENGE